MSADAWKRTDLILREILAERDRQDAKWGEQDHPDFVATNEVLTISPDERCRYYFIPTPDEAKSNCESARAAGVLAWADILVEEVSETIGAENESELCEELIHVAAVCTAWVEAIRRRAEDEAKRGPARPIMHQPEEGADP
jgi:hypothetical protein